LGKIYEYDGIRPVIDPAAYIHPEAVIMGDVIIEAGVFIAPCASLRGDMGRLIVREGANIQDNCVMHGFPGKDCIVDRDGHIGHGAILHGCHVGENVLIGMGAVIMDGAVIGRDSIVGALAFVKAGFAAPPRSLIAGMPASIRRELRDDEIAWKRSGTAEYQALAVNAKEAVRPCEPLDAADDARLRLRVANLTGILPKAETGGRD
jgi:phenylacetic acid degradation protein